MFSIDLSLDIFAGNEENCGCFGQLIPMTPSQALIKNILTLLILFFLFKNVNDKKNSSFLLLFNGFLVITVLMFSLLPISNAGVMSLRNDKGIYLMPDGRINIASLSEDKIDYLAKLISELPEFN